jgi:photosystem II stability/assembly factor-like uncharacterized protein
MKTGFLILFAMAAGSAVVAQSPSAMPGVSEPVWQMEESGTTAGLRGIDSVDGTVAWASGTEGTVLRTVDGGAHWTTCAVPDGDKDGATLDFRGVQAWDQKTAIVMASGPGEKSRLYKTTDGCGTWTLLFKNPDKDGFWDTLRMWTSTDGYLAGDPVAGHFYFAEAVKYLGQGVNGGFFALNKEEFKAKGKSEGAFAASNSCVALGPVVSKSGQAREAWFATGGVAGSRVIHYEHFLGEEPERLSISSTNLPMFPSGEGAGIFSIGIRDAHRPESEVLFREGGGTSRANWDLVVVGGDYTKPNDSRNTAAVSKDSGSTWTASAVPPHGYRSTVQWGESIHAWITAGTNGSDISRDDGKTWQPLDNGNWNALSLPFIVGPKGRIARLNAAALPKQ